jgi:hypothetical protein
LFFAKCRETKKSKGLAYILYLLPDDAVKAYRELDGQIFQVGRGRDQACENATPVA